MALATISLTSVKNYAADLSKDTFDSLKFVSLDGGELATVSGSSIYNIILGNNDTAGSLTYRISAAEDNILTLNNKLGDGFSDTETVTQQFSAAKERITVAEETAQVAASTLDNFLTVTDGKDFLFLLDDLTVPVGRLDKLTDGSYFFYHNLKITSWNIPLPVLSNSYGMFTYCTSLTSFSSDLPELVNAIDMFNGCEALTDFTGILPSLKNGINMFSGCKLNLASIQNIAENINSVTSGSITIGVSADLQGNSELNTAIQTIRAKGWTVTEQYNA